MGNRLFDLGATLWSYLRPARIDPRDPPFTALDVEGHTIRIRPFRDGDIERLVDMYDGFSMDDRAQGIPPLGDEATREWLTKMAAGHNVVAVHDGTVVGHVVFAPDGTGRHELAIFVHPDYQRAGIGSMLMAGGLGDARSKGVTYVWLSVEATERGVQRFYERAGFSTVNPMGMHHRMSRYL